MNDKKPVLLVGPRATPDLVSGMRIGFELLISGFQERGLPYTVVDRSTGMSGKKVGTLTITSVLASLYLFLVYWKGLFSARSVYITISISRPGFIRDALMIWSARLFRTRVILHLKGGGYLSFYNESHVLLKACIRKTFATADTIIVLGDLLRDQFKFVPGITTKLRVVPNGLPKDLAVNRQRPKSLDDSAELRLLYLSNLIPAKGYIDLLEACAILQERGLPIICDFCGAIVNTVNDEGIENSEEWFWAIVKQLGIKEIVRYHGTVQGKAKERFLQNAHLFVLPTYYSWEGQPISIIEALAFGTPVISTRYRGIPEEVRHDHNGFLVSPRCAQEIADAVERLWRDPDTYRQFSQNALMHFRENFTQDSHLDRLLPILLSNSRSV